MLRNEDIKTWCFHKFVVDKGANVNGCVSLWNVRSPSGTFSIWSSAHWKLIRIDLFFRFQFRIGIFDVKCNSYWATTNKKNCMLTFYWYKTDSKTAILRFYSNNKKKPNCDDDRQHSFHPSIKLVSFWHFSP